MTPPAAAGRPGHVGHAAHHLGQFVQKGAVTIGTRQEPLDRTVDDPRVDAGAPLVAEAEALEDPWRVVVEQDVGPTHQSGEDLAPGLALQVDRQAALVAVQGVEGTAAVRHRPGLVATPRLLDLDNVSTQVGQ